MEISMSNRKPYNPNKRLHQLQSKLGNIYEFEMTFCIEEINKVIDAYRDEHNLPEDAYCPEFLTIDAYKQQDLIIALKMQQLKTPSYWEIGIDSHFYNMETEGIYTIPFYIELPEMSHEQLMNGSEVKVMRGHGLKTRWKGLQSEMIEHWGNVGIPPNYDLTRSDVKIKAHAKFKDVKMMNEHNYMLKLRDTGILIRSLKKWHEEQRDELKTS